jgi:16S rRNA (guanine966-N2)-methyltransferase
MIRIQSGLFKGMYLPFLPDPKTRPTTQKVREALLNSLGESLFHASFLDLFSGSGAVGVEAASRGAREVVLVEKDRKVALPLENFLKTDQRIQKARIQLLREDCLSFVRRFQGEPFDIVFMDPPYEYPDWEELLRCLASSGIVQKQESVIVLEYYHRDDPSGLVSQFFPGRQIRITSYGESRILFARNVNP